MLDTQEPYFCKDMDGNQSIYSRDLPTAEGRVHFLKAWYQAEEIL